jgi:hypothetical protein
MRVEKCEKLRGKENRESIFLVGIQNRDRRKKKKRQYSKQKLLRTF